MLFVKIEGRKVKQDSFYLVHEPDIVFEWKGIYESQLLVSAKLKKGATKVSSEDVIVDHELLKKLNITLWDDSKGIANRINAIMERNDL